MGMLVIFLAVAFFDILAVNAFRGRLDPAHWRGLDTPEGRSFYRAWAVFVFVMSGAFVVIMLVGVGVAIFKICSGQ